MSTILHVWDLAHPEAHYACRAEPQQPAICFILVSSLACDVRRMERTSRVCGNCKRIIRARARRAPRGGKG